MRKSLSIILIFLLILPVAFAGSFFEGSVWDAWLSSNANLDDFTGWSYRIVPSSTQPSCPLTQEVDLTPNAVKTICGVDVVVSHVDTRASEAWFTLNKGNPTNLQLNVREHVKGNLDFEIKEITADRVHVLVTNSEAQPRTYIFTFSDWF